MSYNLLAFKTIVIKKIPNIYLIKERKLRKNNILILTYCKQKIFYTNQFYFIFYMTSNNKSRNIFNDMIINN